MPLEESLPDAHRTLNAIAHQGYTPQTAIADIVDNSVSANATKIFIKFDQQVDNSTLVYVADNGVGMSLSTLRRAMQIGSAAELAQSTLSVYGMGMKAASMSFSPKFTVITRDQDGISHYASWDLDDQLANPWTIDIGKANSQQERILNLFTDGGSGTLVVWERADFKDAVPSGNKRGKVASNTVIADEVKSYLGMAFNRFISGNVPNYERIDMYFNDERIEGWDPVHPDFLSDTWTPVRDEFTIDLELQGELVSVPYSITTYLLKNKEESTPELLKRSRLGMKTQGIYPYRENRLLQSPTWLDVISFHPDWNGLRVILELDPRLDSVTRTDMKKSGLSLPPQMWESLKEKLEFYSRNVRSQVRARSAERRSKVSTSQIHKSSNAAINAAYPDIEKPVFSPLSESTVEIETFFGKSVTELSSTEVPMTSRDSRIEPVEDLKGGVLFEPVLRGADQVILLNKSHPFYQKIYMSLYQDPLAIRGLDFLLYSLAQAEMLTRTDRIKEQFFQMRQQMSNTLRSFVAELDEPKNFIEDEE